MRVIIILWCCVLAQTAWSNVNSHSADILFKHYAESIFQVRIIDINSGSQSSIGTGFLVNDGSLLATNYHVISSMVDKPEQYRAEININSTTYDLGIVSFDVVHDLAILQTKAAEPLGLPLQLSLGRLSKGTTLYSIGNPHDIGMTVVEGTYNGLVEHRFLDSIHFSGSINPGMSGGPTIDHRGGVVGINVATSGDQIGFLVPVDKLHHLLQRLEHDSGKDYFALISEQISSFSDSLMDSVLDDEWPLELMGSGKVIGKISDALSCWGNSRENKELGIDSISKGCSNKDNIYISPTFTIGSIEYEYQHFATKEWNSFSFYQYVSQSIANARGSNRADKKSANNYQCQNNVLEATSASYKKKVSYCVRSYKKVAGLYDVFYVATSLDKKHEAMVEHYTLSGVSEVSANRFLRRFMESSSWQ